MPNENKAHILVIWEYPTSDSANAFMVPVSHKLFPVILECHRRIDGTVSENEATKRIAEAISSDELGPFYQNPWGPPQFAPVMVVGIVRSGSILLELDEEDQEKWLEQAYGGETEGTL